MQIDFQDNKTKVFISIAFIISVVVIFLLLNTDE